MEWGPKASVWDFSQDIRTEDDSIVLSPLGSSKRARTRATDRILNLSCLVDECVSDLSTCREYHRRHRVCEEHSKTPVVIIGGKERRWCQQCSRFHSLGEFDEEKRSCRKRLEGHNRRRRKLQPETFFLNSGSFLSHDRGKGLVISKPCALPTLSRCAKNQEGLLENGQSLTSPTGLAHIYNGGNRLFPGFPPNASGISKRTASGHGLGRALTQSMETKCALSFLSSKRKMSPSLFHSGGHFDVLAQHSRAREVEEKPTVLIPNAPSDEVDSLRSRVVANVAPDHLLEKGGLSYLDERLWPL